MKASAEEVARAAPKYLGKPYSEMDCQEFVERCLRDAGAPMNLPGSNAWYREVMRNGWAGTPEECKEIFGSVPKGAFLFILKQNGKEPAKYRRDGIGNASHIGLVTWTGKGAIHSSSSRGCVAESDFKGKTIPNGGWNRVGLWNVLSYGAEIDAALEKTISDPMEQDEEAEVQTEQATVWAENGQPVKMRASREKGTAGYGMYDEIPVGTVVDVISQDGTWSQVNYGRRHGWYIQSRFLKSGSGEAHEAPAVGTEEDEVTITLSMSRADAERLAAALERLSWAISQQIGGLG